MARRLWAQCLHVIASGCECSDREQTPRFKSGGPGGAGSGTPANQDSESAPVPRARLQAEAELGGVCHGAASYFA
jgi:hypothetical protein